MALKKVTKTIPLAGGIQEEAQEFLLQPPGMTYIENGRYRKKDSVEKTEPIVSIGATGASNFTNTPMVLWSKGDKIVTVGRNELATFVDGRAAWAQQDIATDVLGMEWLGSTMDVAGGQNFSWATAGDYNAAASPNPKLTVDAYVVAYEQQTIDTSTVTVTTDVVCQVYDANGGELIGEKIFPNHCQPLVQPSQFSQRAILHVVSTLTGTVEAWRVIAQVDIAATTFTSSGTGPTNVQLYHQQYNDTNLGWGTPGAENSWDNMRAGFSRDARIGNGALCSYKRPWDTNGVLAWKDEVTESLKWSLIDGNGALTGGTTNFANDVGQATRRKLLSCAYDGTDVYILYTTSNPTSTNPSSDLVAYRIDGLGVGPPSNKILVSGQNGTFVNGSIDFDSVGDATIAVTFAHGDVIDELNDGDNNLVRWYRLDSDWSTVNDTNVVYNHRVVSNVHHDEFDFPHVVLQQWSNWNPDTKAAPFTDPDAPTITPTLNKPVTSLLVKLADDTSNLHTVIASYDAGQSKHMDGYREEQNIHLGNLYFYNNLQETDVGGNLREHQWLFGNRNLLSFPDYFYYVAYDISAKPFPTAPDSRVPLLPGTARMNIYNCRSDAPITSVSLTNGFVLGAAVPLWYDGSSIGEASVLDQPEIVRVDTDGDGNTYTAYADLGLATDEPKAYQVITGYYDNDGNVHRSAPSTPLYVGNMLADDTNEARWIKLTITPPLSIFRERQYFAEAYESQAGGVMKLAQVVNNLPFDASAQVTLQFAVNLDPTSGAKEVDIYPFRSGKAIYTAGNVLPVDPWPSFDFSVKQARRIFAHSIASPGSLFYSKIIEEGLSPEFSASLVISIGNEEITALGAVDDKLIAFTKNSVFVVYGTGPDNTGANGDFFVEQVNTPLGCEDPESVITTPDGIIFFSSVSGTFQILTRDLQLVEIGSPVEDLSEDIDIKCAGLYPLENEVRFYVDGPVQLDFGPVPDTGTGIPPRPPRPRFTRSLPDISNSVLVYNYHYQKWSVLSGTNTDWKRCTLFRNKPVGIEGTWVAWNVSDNWAASELMKLETPWIKVNQLQDYGRFWAATFLGKYLSDWKDNGSGLEAGDLKVTVKYDYEGLNGSEDVYLFRANLDFAPELGERLQFKLNGLSRQKCQAVKFIVEEQATTKITPAEPTYTNGRGFEFTGVDLVYGAKIGSSRKLGQRRSK